MAILINTLSMGIEHHNQVINCVDSVIFVINANRLSKITNFVCVAPSENISDFAM